MNGLVALSADFLERLGNPQHGPTVNENYAVRLEEIEQNDPGMTERLATVELSVDDVATLSVDSWLWYLDWRRPRGGLPNATFLEALYTTASEPSARLRIIEVVSFDPAASARAEALLNEPQLAPSNVPNDWLAGQVADKVYDHDRDGGLPQLEGAIELATYLLQLGNPVTIVALRALMAAEWSGRQALQRAVEDRLDAAGLDEGRRQEWRARLGLNIG
jgi:hypothetical protein